MNLNRIKADLDERFKANPNDMRVVNLRKKVARAVSKRDKAAFKAAGGTRTRKGSPEWQEGHMKGLQNRRDRALKSGKTVDAIADRS